jgi:hypothetical protein
VALASLVWRGGAMEGFAAAFASLEDPRTGNAKRYLLLEILLIALCTVLRACLT